MASLFRRALTPLVALALTAPAVAQADVPVAFLQGEQMSTVKRPGSTVMDAERALLAGPTAAERKRGVRTYIPAGTKLLGVAIENGVASVDVSLKFVQDEDADSLRARLAQVVRTAIGTEGVKGVRVLVDGGVPLGLFPGIDAQAVLTLDYLETPDVQAPPAAQTAPPKPKATAPAATVADAQRKLIALGYLGAGGDDGKAGPGTAAAVMAFQKWEGLARDGVLGPMTKRRLATARRPVPRTRAPGRRMEVLLGKQLALAIENNRVVRTLHVSTGKASTPTPPGTFKVYAQFQRWWSTPFREYLLWASPFNAGIAFHQYPDVPAFAASHGCVRVTASQAQWLFRFLRVGNQVKVIG